MLVSSLPGRAFPFVSHLHMALSKAEDYQIPKYWTIITGLRNSPFLKLNYK